MRSNYIARITVTYMCLKVALMLSFKLELLRVRVTFY